MKKLGLLLINLSALVLASCAVGPDFKAPISPKVTSYTHDPIAQRIGNQTLLANQMVSSEWWFAFKTPALNQVIQKGMASSYTLVSMKETLKEARENVKVAEGGLYPQVSMNGNVARQKYGVAMFGASDFSIAPFTYYGIGPSASWTLDIFGQTRRTIEQQKAIEKYQKQELQSARLALTGNITITALQVATLHDQIQSINQIILSDKKNLLLAQQAFTLGQGTKLQVLTAESQLDTDMTLLPSHIQRYHEAQNTLNILVGALPSEWKSPYFSLNQFTLPTQLPLSIPSQLIHQRPDILAAEALLHAACAEVGVATANLYPQLTLSAQTAQQSLTTGGLFDASANAGNIIGGLSAPIFKGGSLKAAKAASEHAYKATYANYKQVVVEAFVQVANILSALEQDNQKLKSTEKALATTKASLVLARESYTLGGGTFLEILAIERLYNEAQLNYVEALGQRYEDTAQLYLVLGGGIEKK